MGGLVGPSKVELLPKGGKPRRRFSLFLALACLLVLPLILYAPVALGHRTLLPVDALFLDQPYRAAADELGVGTPENPLLTDLILENYAWKLFLRDAVRTRQLPLWDPFLFAGHPFLANGQHSGLYPLSVIFYVFPVWRSYGLFAWLQLALAGWWAYLFARTLKVGRLGALISGIVFQLSGFLVVSVVHPMIVAAASWLPLILAMMERVIQQRPALGGRPATLPWALLGAVGLGCHMLAGHAENTYFVLLVMALYATWRLAGTWRSERRAPVRATVWLAILVILGLALGTVQFLPLYEVVADSFRSGEMAASLAQVRGWAYPPRRLITFGIPNFFGSPAHHGHFDLFQWRWVPATVSAQGEPILSHDWGIKNYVEGGAYLGLLPLFLALIAVLGWLIPRLRRWRGATGPAEGELSSTARHTIPFFALLSLFSLGCIFGTPLYAIVYALPLISQSHSPFRWVFPLTLSVAILAGYGVDAVRRRRTGRAEAPRSIILRVLFLDAAPSLITGLAALAVWGGAITLVGLVLSRVFFSQIEPLIAQVFWGLARAAEAFADHRAFYSYEFKWIGLFGLLLIGTGAV
ncbi:MAG: hypothetical protein PVI59_09140, partial [Anaerolineae bacterium]